MDINNEKIKITCPDCKQEIILTFNTSKCPICQNIFESSEVHELFYNYESQVLNSSAYKNGENMNSAGDILTQLGGCLKNIGCIIFLLPITVFLIYIFFSLL